MEACKEEVRRLLSRLGGDDNKIVQAADDLEDMFRKMGWLYNMQISPRQVGAHPPFTHTDSPEKNPEPPHAHPGQRTTHSKSRQVGWDPANRHGEGGNAAAVFDLMGKIGFAGWSWEECSQALCVEAGPGNKAIEEFNRRVCGGTDLAPVEVDTIIFGSLACGHTNMGLRAIAAGMPSDHPLMSVDGRFSVEALRKHDQKFADAVSGGLRWKVLSHKVRAEFPEALNIIQAACCPWVFSVSLFRLPLVEWGRCSPRLSVCVCVRSCVLAPGLCAGAGVCVCGCVRVRVFVLSGGCVDVWCVWLHARLWVVVVVVVVVAVVMARVCV